MPDYVIDEPDGPPPVVVPDPEPEPELVRSPTSWLSRAQRPSLLPRRSSPLLCPRKKKTSARSRTSSSIRASHRSSGLLRRRNRFRCSQRQPSTAEGADEREARADDVERRGALLPPDDGVPDPARRRSTTTPHGRQARPRPRPAAELGKSKRSTEPAEPGDEGNEVGWMAGLSNRLSAYSLSDDEAQSASEPDAHEPLDENTED